jgi:hypothetical protein
MKLPNEIRNQHGHMGNSQEELQGYRLVIYIVASRCRNRRTTNLTIA